MIFEAGQKRWKDLGKDPSNAKAQRWAQLHMVKEEIECGWSMVSKREVGDEIGEQSRGQRLMEMGVFSKCKWSIWSH